ncbi:DUF2625 family protein [Actinomycetes bacterium KLBMP 9759]
MDRCSGWANVENLVRNAPTPVTVLPGDRTQGDAALEWLGVTDRSMLGALVRWTGGLVVDSGWVRVMGGAGELDIRRLNPGPPSHLVIAHDVLGGVFVLNGRDPHLAGLPGEPGEVLYRMADDGEWNRTEFGHSVWLHWLLSRHTTDFFADLRWPGWEAETAGVGLSQGLSVYPPLPTLSTSAERAAAGKRAVAIGELLLAPGRRTAS